MSLRTTMRRSLAVTASALLAVAGTVAVTSPAHAQRDSFHTVVTGTTDCADTDTGEWTVTWTITAGDPGPRHDPETYELTTFRTGIEVGDKTTTADVPAPDDTRSVKESFVLQQTLSAEATSVRVTRVSSDWHPGRNKSILHLVAPGGTDSVKQPAACEVPAPPAPVEVDAEHTCDGLIVRVHNPDDGEDTTVVLTPSEGETVELPIGPGQTLEQLFSGDDGLTVAVTVGDDDAIHYEWRAPEDCDDPGAPGEPGEPGDPTEPPTEPGDGEGGGDDELPLTGSATGMAIIGAVLLLALGAGLFLLARRRPVTFTT